MQVLISLGSLTLERELNRSVICFHYQKVRKNGRTKALKENDFKDFKENEAFKRLQIDRVNTLKLDY